METTGSEIAMIGWNRSLKKETAKPAELQPNATLYEGDVRLEITPFESFKQIDRYKKYLVKIPGISIVADSWSEEDGFSVVVSVRTPVALGRLLENMPGVARVQYDSEKPGRSQKHGQQKMVVVVNALQKSGEPALV
jgi:hypothetical protein